VVTPLDENEDVDVQALRRIVRHIVDHGPHGIFVLGSTGEFSRLEDEQKRIACEVCIQEVSGKAPVYVGVSDCGTKKVISHIRMAETLGADVIVCTLPYYYPIHDEEEQMLFFRQVIETTHLPVLLYNIPATIGLSIRLSVIERLAATRCIVGIKDSSGDMAYFSQIMAIKKKTGLIVFAGAEKIMKDALFMGADGTVPALGNVFPRLLTDLYDACMAGDKCLAEILQNKIDEITRFNACTNSWQGIIAFRKKALSLMGLCSDRLTEPYLRIDDEKVNEIARMLEEMKDWRPILQ
jgi:dihydrodipicolinate synthase/N-acetylneuraminate lyase